MRIDIRIIFILSIALLSGCNDRPKGVLSDNKMAEVVADMEIAEAYVQTRPMPGEEGAKDDAGPETHYKKQESYKEMMMSSVLKRHRVSKADFDSSMVWYGRNLDAYYKLDVKVKQNIDKRRHKLAGIASSTSGETETEAASDLWPYERMVVIDDNSGSGLLNFSLDGSALRKGESVEWKGRFRNTPDASMMLGVEYKDGTATYVSRVTDGQKKFVINLQTDTALEPSRIFGYLHMNDNNSLPEWIDSIALHALPYDSTQYYRYNSQKKLK